MKTLMTALLFTVLIGIIVLFGCGKGSSGSSISSPTTPVHAAGFTNANVSGGYGFGVAGTSGAVPEVGTGVVTADGNGNLTGGEETVNIGGISCHATFTGTYSVNANGTGTVTLNTTLDADSIARGCTVGASTVSSLALANNGGTLVVASQGSGGALL